MCQSEVIKDSQLSFTPTLIIEVIAALLGCFGFLFKIFIVDPILAQKKEIQGISSSLTFYAWAIASPNHPDIDKDKTVALKERSVAADILCKHSADLRAISGKIPLYNLWPIRKYVIKHSNILEACQKLMGLSNSVVTGHSSINKEDVAILRKLLGIES